MLDFTEDFILDGAIKLLQPKNGYRVAMDPILLVSQVEIKSNQSILDAGCGVGTMSLILKHMDSSLKITSVDIDSDMTDLCKQNSENNYLPLDIINCSVDSKSLKQMEFDCIVTNPPFYDISDFRISNRKRSANFETIDLNTWLSSCIKRLKFKGNFYIIHIAERLADILNIINEQMGKIEIIPICSYKDQQAKRIILKCRKGSKESLRIMPPLVIHNEDGEFSKYVKDILKGQFRISKNN